MRNRLSIAFLALASWFTIALPAFALTVNMRPAAGQTAPGTVTQTDGSVVTPDANGNFALTQVLTIANQFAQGWIISVPAGSVNILGNVTAGSVNLDLSKGCYITETLTGNITHTFSNAAYCKSQQVCVATTQDGTGGRSITWTGFSGVTPPQPAQGVAALDQICFADDGTHVIYPTIGSQPTFGEVVLNGSTSGALTLLAAATTTSYSVTMPSAAPSASGQVLSATTGGVGSWIAVPGSLGWDGALGSLTASAVKATVAPCTGHFTKLACTATLTGSCTTGPTINVGDITGSTTGTAVSPTTTVATVATASETLAFTSGDTIALEQTATVSSCTAPTYGCAAQYTCP